MRARDVQLLFADANSGARSATMVNQGQIGALVEAPAVVDQQQRDELCITLVEEDDD